MLNTVIDKTALLLDFGLCRASNKGVGRTGINAF
jgi:hypothetical protein